MNQATWDEVLRSLQSVLGLAKTNLQEFVDPEKPVLTKEQRRELGLVLFLLGAGLVPALDWLLCAAESEKERDDYAAMVKLWMSGLGGVLRGPLTRFSGASEGEGTPEPATSRSGAPEALRPHELGQRLARAFGLDLSELERKAGNV